MKAIFLSFNFLLLAFPILVGEQKDPSESTGSLEWHEEEIKNKPYWLEIAYGDTEHDLNEHVFITQKPSKTFLEDATKFALAISANESGELEQPDSHQVRYEISQLHDGNFDLRLYLKTTKNGLREINTDITLKLSEWIVLVGPTLQTDDKSKRSFIFAVRIR